jgi:hypothetical protein
MQPFTKGLVYGIILASIIGALMTLVKCEKCEKCEKCVSLNRNYI